jgi:hypothetical protein
MDCRYAALRLLLPACSLNPVARAMAAAETIGHKCELERPRASQPPLSWGCPLGSYMFPELDETLREPI